MTIEMYLQGVFQVATALVITMWAVVGVVVSGYYAYKTAESLIHKRTGYIKRLKKSKLYSIYMDKGLKRASK